MKYVYPAKFTKEDTGYSVIFPDLSGCYTCGDDLADAILMAEDVLAFTLFDYEKEGTEIPTPSLPQNIKADKNSFVSMIMCDTLEYHKMKNSKAVKKTLTIPEWLNELAIDSNINFSQVLQNALKQQLHIQ